MNVKKNKDGTFDVESGSKPGKFYHVDIKKPWCDCPAYKFRYLKSKSMCKHMKAVKEWQEINEREKKLEEEKTIEMMVEHLVEAGGEVDSVKLIELYGEEMVDRLIKSGEAVEQGGKIIILK
ncbi:SWIM zinc finger family protein [Candidatus Woesearchaeota archaeon]|nr:SWIM zinc finger family protein [Candidatus Woesearchaeota archaeon]